jgi:hypothetical protein
MPDPNRWMLVNTSQYDNLGPPSEEDSQQILNLFVQCGLPRTVATILIEEVVKRRGDAPFGLYEKLRADENFMRESRRLCTALAIAGALHPNSPEEDRKMISNICDDIEREYEGRPTKWTSKQPEDSDA